jgi:hypothetical protein
MWWNIRFKIKNNCAIWNEMRVVTFLYVVCKLQRSESRDACLHTKLRVVPLSHMKTKPIDEWYGFSFLCSTRPSNNKLVPKSILILEVRINAESEGQESVRWSNSWLVIKLNEMEWIQRFHSGPFRFNVKSSPYSCFCLIYYLIISISN